MSPQKPLKGAKSKKIQNSKPTKKTNKSASTKIQTRPTSNNKHKKSTNYHVEKRHVSVGAYVSIIGGTIVAICAALSYGAYIEKEGAHIQVNGIDAGEQHTSSNGILYWVMLPVVRNVGGTPSKRTVENFITQVDVVPAGFEEAVPSDPDDPFDNYINRKDASSNLEYKDIGPGDKFIFPPGEQNAAMITMEHLQMMKNTEGRLAISVMGVFHYKNGLDYIFDRDHVTKFCYHVKAVPGPNGIIPDWLSCKHWNCKDAECVADKRAYDFEYPSSVNGDIRTITHDGKIYHQHMTKPRLQP